ncbi:MFS transporter [Poseidonocella sp. HB161398]|uniref:MFS transporter n=1 Tax=Poseidonocella sp. HB161398 TaxID=2320855 RepID=UPI001108E8AB|nr:MFS transporter [Poseidonocella sp. HB161398]
MAKVDNRQYSILFQVKLWAIFSVGVATVELSVIAYNIAGPDASALLGTALSLKSLAYVVAPLLMAVAFERLPRGRFLILLDIIRALALLSLLFVSGRWSFLTAIAVFLAASAAFKITYIEYVAHLLPDHEDFSWAITKSRIADELEGVVSPLAAAALLFLLPIDAGLLAAAAVFAVSALRIRAAGLPDLSKSGGGYGARALRGLRLYLSDRTLRPLTWLMLATAAGTAMVTTTTPYLVQSVGGLGSSATALAYGAFGAGSILGALGYMRFAADLDDSRTMLLGGALIACGLLAGMAATQFATIALLWAAIGAGGALIQVPGVAVIRDAAQGESLLVVFGGGLAMQNLILAGGYGLAGGLAAAAGPVPAFAATGGISALAVTLAWAGLRRARRHRDAAAAGMTGPGGK